jgi:hypothetical protein
MDSNRRLKQTRKQRVGAAGKRNTKNRMGRAYDEADEERRKELAVGN